MSTITVDRRNYLVSRHVRRPFTWLYSCEGPDGRRFTNTSIVELRRVLRARYGRNIEIVEPWKI